jgi:hypothetical protein
MCDKSAFRPARSAEELLALKKKVDQERLDKLKRQHEDMGFIKDNMR